MKRLMRCLFCGALQDEPEGVKACVRCGGELGFEPRQAATEGRSYLEAEMELDQVKAPAGKTVDRHLLVTLRTSKSVPPEHAAPAGPGRPRLHFTAVLDVSGSMRGEKLSQVKEALRQALRHLNEGDFLSVVTFSDKTRLVLKAASVSPKVAEHVESTLREIEAGGMTALCSGLELALKEARKQRVDTNLILLLSDGQANVGETDVEQVGTRGRQAREQGITVSTLGVGQDYNEALMAEIATQGGGRYYHLQTAGQIVAYLTGELGEAANLAARETRLHLALPDGAVVVPLSAAYPAEQKAGLAEVTVGDLPCDQELEVPLRLTLTAGQVGSRVSVKGEVRYRSPAGRALATGLNRVTVRFVEARGFDLREGVVMPVVERVARQMHNMQVLEVSRAMTCSPEEGRARVAASRSRLRDYLNLLGDDPAREALAEMGADYDAMAASPQMAKATVAAAYRRARSTKLFDK